MIEEAKEIFSLFDKVKTWEWDLDLKDFQDGDCSIPTQELGTAMRAMGTFPKVPLLSLSSKHYFESISSSI